MANLLTLIDVTVSPEDFDNAHAEMLRLKVDRNGARPSSDAWRKAIAAWANWVDDLARAFQRRLADHETRIAAIESGGGDADTLQGATLTEAMKTAIEESDGTPSLNVDLIQIDQATGLSLTSADGGLTGIVRAVRAAASTITDSTNSAGTAASLSASDHGHAHGTRGGGTLHADVVAAGAAGFMTGADKTKLDGITAGANVVETGGSRVIRETIFSALANNTFANGTEVLDGLNFTAFSVAAAGTFDNLNGTGIRWIPLLNTAGVFNNTNQTAAGLYIDVGSYVGSSFNAGKRYRFEFYYSSRTLNAVTRIGPFLWAPTNVAPNPSTARVRGGGVNQTTPHLAFVQQQATATNGVEDVSTHNVFGIEVAPTGHTYVSSGIWSSGWPSLDQRMFNTTAFATAGEGLHRSDTRLVISHSHNAQNPVVDTVVLERMRAVEL